jgi:hypothetical protein
MENFGVDQDEGGDIRDSSAAREEIRPGLKKLNVETASEPTKKTSAANLETVGLEAVENANSGILLPLFLERLSLKINKINTLTVKPDRLLGNFYLRPRSERRGFKEHGR